LRVQAGILADFRGLIIAAGGRRDWVCGAAGMRSLKYPVFLVEFRGFRC
jgi:hypothetical protein